MQLEGNLTLLAIVLTILPVLGPLRAQADPPGSDPSKPVREIFIPFEELDVLLENQPRRVLLSRREYEDLRARAEIAEAESPPRAAAIIAADYDATVRNERARITGKLVIDVLADGLHTVGLPLASVGLRTATLDATTAPIGRADDGRLVLFVEGKGRHALQLEMVAPLETTAARQILNFRLPTPASTTLRLTMPGDVEIKSGSDAVRRVVDQAAGVTRFELLPRRDDVSLVMTLNSRLLRRQRVVVARGVMVDEVTQAYERIHATYSMAVLHKAVDRFRFVVPVDFEITHVASPLLARWSVTPEGERRILEVRLREPTTETVVLNLSAVRTPGLREDWTLSRLEPLEVEGEVAVVGLLLEDRLRAEAVQPAGLIPIDTAVLTRALPGSVFEAEPGAPQVRPILAYYAPQSGFRLTARFTKPPPRLLVTTNLLLTLEEKGHQLRGGFILHPEVEKRFGFDFTLPADWHVTRVTAADDSPLSFERSTPPDQPARIRVRLPQGVPVGESYQAFFEATRSPAGWLGGWTQTTATFPTTAVDGATREIGAVAVAVADDLTVRPETIENLTPLDEAKKGEFGLAGVATTLAYRFEDPAYRAELVVERRTPRLTARTYSFFVVEPDQLTAHYEIRYDVEEARTRRLMMSLPETTPVTLSIRGLDDVAIKEFSSTTADGRRTWTVLLGEPRAESIGLAVDFQQPIADEALADLSLPVVRAEDVAYQSGIVSVEGSAELDVALATELRKVDEGELVDARYQPGKRLLGTHRFVGDDPEVSIKATRRPGYDLPSALGRRAELVTLLSATGLSQTAARFYLRAKAPFLEVKLPAGSTLWSSQLDGRTTKPQRDGETLLLSLPPASGGALRDLHLVYETPIDAVTLRGSVQIPAPSLRFRSALGKPGLEVPLADLRWQVHLPAGYRVTRTGGTVVTHDVPEPELALSTVGRLLYALAGGVNLFYDFPKLARARELGLELRGEPAFSHDGSALPGGWESSVADDEERFGDLDGAQFRAGERLEADQAPTSEPRGPASPPTPTAQPVPPVVGALAGKDDDAGVLGRPSVGAWALQGVRSLKIDLQATGDRVGFRSLGAEPRIDLTLSHRGRFDALAWGLAGVVLLLGLARQKRSVRSRAKLVVAVMLVTTLASLISGSAELTGVLNASFYAACLLVPAYLLIALTGWIARRARGSWMPVAATTAAVLLVAVFAAGRPAIAAESQAKAAPYVIQVTPPPEPITVPADAIILPYDPEARTGIPDVQQMLVPYDRFVALWNRAHADKRLTADPPPAQYALAGAVFRAVLESDEVFLVEGSIDLDLFVPGFVAVPLPLAGGVLARADLDGSPARLGLAQPVPTPPGQKTDPPPQAQQASRQGPGPTGSLIVLHVSGKGRHRLELAVRMRLARSGGWRVAKGRLPVAAAAGLTLRVPAPQTEVRLGGVPDRPDYLTTQADETIETALAAGGEIDLRWRPKVSEGAVDQSLTAESTGLLDVQEDGLRVVWRLRLAFRRGEREQFSLRVPPGYLVAKVEGPNVQGWELRPGDDHTQLEVSLLEPARTEENLAIHLRRSGAVGRAELAEFDAPVVDVDGAALHHGQLILRRSPLLDLRTVTTAGLTRTDLPDGKNEAAAVGVESPLGIRPYQAYRFAATPFSLRLAAAPVAARTAATVQAIVRIAPRDRTLEAKVNLDVKGRPIYAIRIELPDDLELERVDAPGAFEWALTTENERKRLTLHLATGQTGSVPILLTGRLGPPATVQQIALPRLVVLDVARLDGQIVVQTDPGLEVQATDLAACESILLERVHGWLQPGQRPLARLALAYRSPDYRGTLRVSPRTPIVNVFTVTNVRVTDRAIEETILLDFDIRQAGIRELAFLLPERLADARISVPQLRLETVEPAPNGPAGWVRVRLELQDQVTGQLRVLVEHDRLLTPQTHEAPIPIVETGRTDRRYVLLESAGRDEVVVDRTEGLDSLGRQQAAWQWLTKLLGGAITQAYLVQPDTSAPVLAFRTEDRAVVETVGARILLAETLLVVDSHGTYRAAQTLRVDNRTEQFLEVQLPEGAELWTAQVAGVPVKPSRVLDTTRLRHVRIPLVKTAAGDLDYAVVLKYGGSLPPSARSSRMTFPLIRTENIRAELSQVRLYLPDTYHWLDFEGTMRQVSDEGDLAAGYVSYQSKRAQRLAETMRSAGAFAKVRAMKNFKRLKSEIDTFQQTNEGLPSNKRLQQEWASNDMIILQTEEQDRATQESLQDVITIDNRSNLGQLFEQQKVSVSGDAINGGANFDLNLESATTRPAESAGQFDHAWLSTNALTPTVAPSDTAGRGRVMTKGKRPTDGKVGGERRSSFQTAIRPQKEAVTEGEQSLERSTREQARRRSGSSPQRHDAQTLANRYQVQLESQTAVDQTVAVQPAQSAASGRMTGRGEIDASSLATVTVAPAVVLPAGLASLDVEIPRHGTVYRFTAPQGEVTLTARNVSRTFLVSLEHLGMVLGVIVLAGGVYGIIRRARTTLRGRRPAAIALIVLGLGGLVTGVLPVAALALVILGIVVLRSGARGEAATNAPVG